MTQALFAAVKTPEVGCTIIDGLRVVILNMVSTSTDAQVKTQAVAAFHQKYPTTDSSQKLPDTYFDSVLALGDLTSGPLNANKLAMFVGSGAPVTFQST